MTEYWKSTPSYWCKFCATYVRDTGLERRNHDATPRHQGNIQRSLRALHKGREREERERQRARDEVKRLNLIVGRGEVCGGGGAEVSSGDRSEAKATPEERRRQAEQLAALGVAVPEEFRAALTGVNAWETLSSRVVDGEEARSLAGIKKEEDAKEALSTVGSRGVRKRRAEGDGDAREEEAAPRRKVWGSSLKSYPGAKQTEDEDLDALLSGIKRKAGVEGEGTEDVVKREGSVEERLLAAVPDIDASDVPVKAEEQGEVPAPPPIAFKKRKGIKR